VKSEWAGKGRENAYKILAEKPLAKRLLNLSWIWEDNIKMDLKETGCKDRRGMELSQDRMQWWA
jgi:hypothetical protein